jgi:hypothetical protein
MGARPEATHAGVGSQPEERHGMSLEVHKIIRRRENPVRRVLKKYFTTDIFLLSNDSIHVCQ